MADFSPADVVAAIATAPGAGAIAIVRLSGPGALVLADRLYRGAAPALAARWRARSACTWTG